MEEKTTATGMMMVVVDGYITPSNLPEGRRSPLQTSPDMGGLFRGAGNQYLVTN